VSLNYKYAEVWTQGNQLILIDKKGLTFKVLKLKKGIGMIIIKLIILAKSTFHKLTIVITTLILFGSGYCFSQSDNTGQNMKTKDSILTKNVEPVYLDKKDPIFVSIKARVINDLKESSKKVDPESPENKLLTEQVKTWPQEKQDRVNALFIQSMYDYAEQTHFDAGIFMIVFEVIGKKDQKELSEENDIRVLNLGNDKYVAEFWEDGIALNSEAHAIAWAHELANSERAKKNPGSGLGNVKEIKKTYADARKLIKDGKKERYTKVFALLYSKEKDGSITFINPFQAIMDFK